MKKILVIGGSTSKNSINKKLATYTAKQVTETEYKVLDLDEFEMPIYSEDREKEGFPKEAQAFAKEIENVDGVVISLAEHNGSYSAAFKNILDWASRSKRELWADKPMLLMATSPGGRGGQTVLASANTYFPFMKANITGTLSLPSFYDNFDSENGIKDESLQNQLLEEVKKFKSSLA